MRRPTLFPAASVTVLLTIAACSSKTSLPDDNHASATTATMADSSVGASSSDASRMPAMGAMAPITGDADHDFLRMMSDHHKGMIAMAHPTIELKENVSVKNDARKLDEAQDAEIKTMLAMLSRQYRDAYTPRATPDDQAMAAELNGKSGTDYSRTFLRNTIAHHQQAIKMIDEYLPKGRNTELKRMAAKMKADQSKEITEFEKKLAALK